MSAAGAAMVADTGVNLRTAPGSAAYLGIDWFRMLERRLDQGFPALPRRLVLDCGGETGLATLALRRGIAVRSDERGILRERLRAFAEAAGSWVDEENRPALDLLDRPFPDASCRDWIEAWIAGAAISGGPSLAVRPSKAVEPRPRLPVYSARNFTEGYGDAGPSDLRKIRS